MKQLELTMHEALEGMTQIATLCAWDFDSSCMEILGVEPPGRTAASGVSAQIIPFTGPRRRS